MKKSDDKKLSHFGYWWYGHGLDMAKTILMSVFIIIAASLILVFIINKEYKIVVSEYEVLRFSDKENADFNMGITADGKQFLLYTEKDGGLILQKYDTDKTTLFKTLSENEKPYVKVKSNKADGVKSVEIYVSGVKNIEIYVSHDTVMN